MDRLMTVINNKVTVEGDNFGQQYILKRTEKRKEIGLIAVAKKGSTTPPCLILVKECFRIKARRKSQRNGISDIFN